MPSSGRRWVAALALIAATGCGRNSSPPSNPSPQPTPQPQLPAQLTGVLVGAGDIAVCNSPGAESTARLLDASEGTVFTAGDNAYFQGSASQYSQCYEPTWGRHRDRTRPTPGNHEYETAGASAYFNYFGENAGPGGLGFYSFEVGNWHVVSLNSNTLASEGSAQIQWLRQDLSSTRARCVAAIWHHPLFSSGQNGGVPFMRDAWRTLREMGADVVIQGHDHIYERFARQDENGRATSDGLRGFVVGTGGAELTNMGRLAANSESRMSKVFGVLKLTLRSDSYTWQFIAVPPATFTDIGSDSCR